MSRAVLHKHVRFFYFLGLILCLPAIAKDADSPKFLEKRTVLSRRPELTNYSAYFVLETFDILLAPKLKTLSNTLRAFHHDKEVRQGEPGDIWVRDSTSITLMPHRVGQLSKVQNCSIFFHALLHSLAANMCKDGNCTRLMDLQPPWKQGLAGTVAAEGLFENLQVPTYLAQNLASPFDIYNPCSWLHEDGLGNNFLPFFDDTKAVQALEMDFKSVLNPPLQHFSLREHMSRLFDEKSAQCTCNQGMPQEFAAKNMRNSPLHVQFLMIKAIDIETNGFKVEHFGDFFHGPWTTTRFQMSYHRDFKVRFSNGEVQLLTFTSMLSVTLKANIAKHIQLLCQNVAFMERVTKIILQICSLALFLLLFVFGRMLKQEGLLMSNVKEWPTATNAAKLCQRPSGKGRHYNDGKKSSIYVQIEIGCSHDKSKQCCRSLKTAVGVVHAAIICIVSLKSFYITHASHVQQTVEPITSERDSFIHNKNETTSAPSSITEKRRASIRLRASSKAASTTGGALSLKNKASALRKTAPPLDVTRTSEKSQPESPCTPHSDKENQKTKQNKGKKGAPFASGIDSGSESASSSLLIPSSPVKQEERCRPVGPLSLSDCTVTRKCESPSTVDAAALKILNDEGRFKIFENHWVKQRDSIIKESKCFVQNIKINVSSEDLKADNLHSSRSRMYSNHTKREAKNSEPLPVMQQGNLVEVATIKSSGKGFAGRRLCSATLTASATFPVPGRRLLQESTPAVKGDGTNPFIWSLRSDLASTSVVAPHARAPGGPLSPKSSPSHKNFLLSSPFVAESDRHQYAQNSIMQINRSGQSSDFKGKSQYTHEMFYHGTSKGSSPRKMHCPPKRQDSLRPDCISFYNLWGNHFADLGTRYGPYWIDKNAPITKKASSLPPLLKTPPFSVFSSHDPFNK